MITTYKSKAYDGGQDVNGLKDQLGSVLKEIAAFGGRLEEAKALELHADDYGFAKSFSYEERLRDLKTKLQPGREPSKPVIFLTRMVVESLSRGPMSEKDIKTIVLERCKELGIKSSNRGLIAGTGMDVATVCCVLAALGAIEAATPPDAKAEPDLSLLASTAHPSLNTTTSTVNTSPETITGPGSALYGVLSERWQSRLHEYIDDALKSKAASLLNDTLNDSTTEASANVDTTAVVKIEGSMSQTGSAVPTTASANLVPSVPAHSLASTVSKSGTSGYIPNTSRTMKSASLSVPLYNPLGSGQSSVVTSAGVTPSTSCNNIAGTYMTSTLPSPNSTTQNSVVASPVPSVAPMSNTARLIAEYNSRNGIDPTTSSMSNATYVPPATTLSYNTTGTVGNNTISSVPPNSIPSGYNNSVTSNISLNGVSVSTSFTPSDSVPVSNISSVNAPTPALNTTTNNLNSSTVNTIGYRAPLGPDASTTSAVYNPLPNATYPVLSSTIPPTYTATYNQNTSMNTSLPGTTNTLNTSTIKPYPIPHSNPATTPATVGFLSVTNPSNKLVLPYMSGDGTLSKSASSNSINNSGIQNGATNYSSNLPSGLNTNMNTTGMNNSLNGTVSSSYTSNTSYNVNSSTYSNMSMNSSGLSSGYQPPTSSYSTSTPMMSYPNNPSMMPLNSAYGNNTSYPMNTSTVNYGTSFVTNTTNPTSYHPVTANTPYTNNNTATNTNTKTKAKTPKPPVEKKVSKKATTAASKLVDNANTARVSNNNTQSNNGNSASSSVTGTVTSGTTGVNSNKARRGPSALRVWKLREEYIQLDISIPIASTDNKQNNNASVGKTTNAALALLLDPSLISTAASIHYAMHAALETEERLLRRIAGLCNFNLKPNRYRLGTAMLSNDPDIMNRTSTTSSRLYGTNSTYTTNNVVSSSKGNTKYSDTSSTDDFFTEPTYSVYDESTPITASYLLDKIRRTKRQRGEILYGNISLPYATGTTSVSAARNAAAASVGVYSAPHVHALASVVSKTTEYFWANTANGKNNKSKKAPAATVTNVNKAEPITMAQYARNVHTGVYGNNVVLSSCSNGASITNQTLRRYAQPIELHNAHLPCDVSKLNAFAAATGGHHNSHATSTTTSNNGTAVLSIPDLTLNTREIAWASIAAEFAILPAPTEEGSIGFGYSASTAAIDTVSGYVESMTSQGNSSVKKRKYTTNDSTKANKASSKANSSGGAENNNSTASTLAMEVLAPQFTEIEPITAVVERMKAQQQTPEDDNNNTSDFEDISDEACLARHEAVLQGMRDKWTRLQQLKNEALYGPGGAPPDTKTYRGGGYGGYFNRAVTAPAGNANSLSLNNDLSPLGSPMGFNSNTKFQNLSPRKRGLASAHAKRRGRPPKNVKHSHSGLINNVVAVVGSVENGLSKEMITTGEVSVSDDTTMEVDELME